MRSRWDFYFDMSVTLALFEKIWFKFVLNIYLFVEKYL